jgi:hypothetical protein
MVFTVARAGSQAALAVGLAIFMNVALGGILDHYPGISFLGMHFNGLTLVAVATIWTVALIDCMSVSMGGRTALALALMGCFTD